MPLFCLFSDSGQVFIWFHLKTIGHDIFIFYIRYCWFIVISWREYLCRHGVFQLLSAWADGPAYVTQCPIRPGRSYTYKFQITRQEGTLWWHAHVSWLRATVHGALIISPRLFHSYPFPKPYEEATILLGLTPITLNTTLCVV